MIYKSLDLSYFTLTDVIYISHYLFHLLFTLYLLQIILIIWRDDGAARDRVPISTTTIYVNIYPILGILDTPPPKPGVRGVKMRNVKTGDLRTQKCLKNVGILTPRRGYIINIGGFLGVFLTSKKGVLFSVKKPLKSTLYSYNCKLNIQLSWSYFYF